MARTLGLRNTAKELGCALADWLNKAGESRPDLPAKPQALLMAQLLGIAQKGAGGRESLAQKWERFWEMLEPYAPSDANIPRLERPVVLESASWGFNVRLVIRPRRDGLTFAAYPEGEDSQAFWSLSQLIQLGLVDRVRLCPNCRHFFFARRADSNLCSQPCRESAWRKSPQGRRARAAYMREYRLLLRERGEAKGYRRKPGRKIHLDVKKGE